MSRFINLAKTEQEYSSLSSTNDDETSSSNSDLQDSLLRGKFGQRPKSFILRLMETARTFVHPSINFIWTLVLLLFTLLLLTRDHHEVHEIIQEWHDTDIEDARPLIERIPVKFTAGLYWNETNGNTTVRFWDRNEPVYVGPRTEALDAAWDDISLPLDLYVTPEEASGIPDIPQGIYADATGNYTVVVESIHTLHCLNMLRKRIYIEDYPEMNTTNMVNHVDHCIEALRFNLMCSADMTPAPSFYSPAIGKMQPNFEITHSCRDFRKLLKWARRRSVHTHYED